MKEDILLSDLRELFVNVFGIDPLIKKITVGGSPRLYYRLTHDQFSMVGVISEDVRENEIFFRLDETLEDNGIKVPHIIAISKDKKTYLIQDLGDTTLFSLLESQGPQRIKWGKMALKSLIEIQTLPEKEWITRVGYGPFSPRLIRWDLNYFKYDYLKPSGIIFNEDKLEDDFDKLVKDFTGCPTLGFMYRDFQSRNIMWNEDKLWFIDFQGARKGPIVYDAVSFIWQAKAPFTLEERAYLEDYYLQELCKVIDEDLNSLRQQFKRMLIFRTLQVLGAYGFRGLIERKSHFLESIPYALGNLNYLRKNGYLHDYPEIERIAEVLEKENQTVEEKFEDGLTLSVFSFSYKKGYPEDLSGNGGGFMFDCRAIHNPGRYEEYRTKTGRDQDVIEFLERTNESGEFVNNAINIVKGSIERYLKRGFTSLHVGFGCTGGQHRSVYCAEKFAEKISKMYPKIKVKVFHREQGIFTKINNC
ncbi:MAG: phosphotransferase [Muribaculaceae bacterium]|nr:phosphotransferase [Muribaculaceae bacterium]